MRTQRTSDSRQLMRRFQMAWESVAVCVMTGTALVVVLVVWAGAELAAALAGAARAPNPLTFVDDVLTRKFIWVRADTTWTALAAGAIVAFGRRLRRRVGKALPRALRRPAAAPAP